MERAVPILPSDDLATDRDFYVGQLGFTETFSSSEDGHSGVLGLERGSIAITIDCPMEGHGRNACVSIHVEDADAFHAEWSARVTGVSSPIDQDWGSRTFDLHDPSGNTIFVIGPIPQRA